MWQTVFWDNTLSRWAIAAGVTVGLVVVLRVVVSVAAARLKRFAATTESDIDDLMADLVYRTRFLFILVVATWGGSYTLALSDRAASGIRAVLVLGLLLQAGFWANALVNYFVARYRKSIADDDPGVATAMGAVGFIARVGVWAVVVLVTLDTLGIDITTLVAGLGVGGIAVALAVQNILGDLFASISIILDKPFVVGDFIVLDDLRGNVEYVGLKTTRIRAQSGEQIVVSNSDLLKSRIRNFKLMAERRVVFEVGVVYGTSHEKMRLLPVAIREAVESQPNTRFDRSHFRSFGNSALVFETVYFMTVPDYNAYMDTQQAINLELYERFEALSVEFAFPTQTLFVHRLPQENVPVTS